MRFDRSQLTIILIIFALYTFMRHTADFDDFLLTTLLSLPGLIIGLSLHEFAHAFVACKLGDPTPEAQGRVTISPLAHLDPLGTICLLFGGFGWGKPVQINPMNFNHPEKDSAKVAAAGPIMNVILCFLFTIIYGIILVIAGKNSSFENSTVFEMLIKVVSNTIILNLGLAIFNLLPFPPLDGSKIYRAFLKGKAKEVLYWLESYSYVFIMILFITGIASYVIIPIERFILNNALNPIVEFIIKIGA